MSKTRLRAVKPVETLRCDRCGTRIGAGHERLVIDKVKGRGEPSDIKVVRRKVPWGTFCENCAFIVLQGLRSTFANPNRVTIGMSNPKLLNHLGDVVRNVIRTDMPRHIELDELDRPNLLVTILLPDSPDPVSWTYSTETKVLVKVPTRRRTK